MGNGFQLVWAWITQRVQQKTEQKFRLKQAAEMTRCNVCIVAPQVASLHC